MIDTTKDVEANEERSTMLFATNSLRAPTNRIIHLISPGAPPPSSETFDKRPPKVFVKVFGIYV